MSAAELEGMLCLPETKPDQALRQLCRTSIIRDEWIAALSLDLSDTERFELVRGALGTVESADYAARAKKVVGAAEAIQTKTEREYEEARSRLNSALAELAAARTTILQAGDLAEALAAISVAVPDLPSDPAEAIVRARSVLADRRLALSELARLAEQAKEVATEREKFPTFHDEVAAADLRAKRLTEERVATDQLLQEARLTLAAEREADVLAASLAALLEHGAHLGLQDGRCPLCDAARSPAEFEAGMARAHARLGHVDKAGETQRRVADFANQLDAIEFQIRQTEAVRAELSARVEKINLRETELSGRFQQLGFHEQLAAVDSQHRLERHLAQESSRLVDLERNLQLLESSQALDRVAEIEAKLAIMRRDADVIADRLARCQRALGDAKGIDRAVRRTQAEIVDERLAMISPLLDELYQRLRPPADWRTIEYSIRGDVRRFLSLKVGDGLNPQFVFSSGQRRAAGLAFLLSVHLARSWCRWNTLLLDDPVQHVDDYRALHLVETLAALRHDNRQIICAVEDTSLADLLCRRLRATSDFPGCRIELASDWVRGTVVVDQTEIPQMPYDVLRVASKGVAQ